MKRTMVSNKIWRTIVVAGAMLATPLAACGGGDKKADTTPAPPPTATEATPAAEDPDAKGITADDAAAQAKFEEEEARKAEEARIAEEKAAADAQAQKEAEEKAAAEQAKKDEEAKKARPRAVKSRPSGRGFILS